MKVQYREIDIAKEARRRARKLAHKGTHVRVIQDKRFKPEKHKKPLKGDE